MAMETIGTFAFNAVPQPGGEDSEILNDEDNLDYEDVDEPLDCTQPEGNEGESYGVDVPVDEASVAGNAEASLAMNAPKEDTPSVEPKDGVSSDVNFNTLMKEVENKAGTIVSTLTTKNLVTQKKNMGANVAGAAAQNRKTISKVSGSPAQNNRAQMKIRAANDAISKVPGAAAQNLIAQITKVSNDANFNVSVPTEIENKATSDDSGTDKAIEAGDNFSAAAADENCPSQVTEMESEGGENVSVDEDGQNFLTKLTDMAGANVFGDAADDQSVLSQVTNMGNKAIAQFSGAAAQEDAMNIVKEMAISGLNSERSSSVAASNVESVGAVSEQSHAGEGGGRESVKGGVTPQEDATNLYNAFKGSGCDAGSIVNILAHRNRRHRSLIRKEYRDIYNEELIARLSSELSTLGKGNIKETLRVDVTLNSTGALSSKLSSNIKIALTLWMLEEDERDATIVKNGLSILSPNPSAVTEVLCSRTPSQLENLQRAYFANFKSQLTDDINSFTSIVFGSHKELLLACLSGERTNIELNKTEKNKKDADADAKKLFEAGESKLGTNQRTFIDIFTLRSSSHLATVDSAYCRLYNHNLEMAVEKETSGYFKDGLLTLLKCAKSSPKYFAEVIHKSINGRLTSKTGTLTRAVVTRAEIDMEEIKQEYEKAYQKSLKEAIHSATSGDYRTFLVSIINTKTIV